MKLFKLMLAYPYLCCYYIPMLNEWRNKHKKVWNLKQTGKIWNWLNFQFGNLNSVNELCGISNTQKNILFWGHIHCVSYIFGEDKILENLNWYMSVWWDIVLVLVYILLFSVSLWVCLVIIFSFFLNKVLNEDFSYWYLNYLAYMFMTTLLLGLAYFVVFMTVDFWYIVQWLQ